MCNPTPIALERWASDYAMRGSWADIYPIDVYGHRFDDSYDVEVRAPFCGLRSDKSADPIECTYHFENGVLAAAPWEARCPRTKSPFMAVRALTRRLGLVPLLWCFALPGMGKTTFCRKFGGYDLDYGTWRRRNEVPSKNDLSSEQYEANLDAFMDDAVSEIQGAHRSPCRVPLIFSNELDLIPFALALGAEVVLVCPSAAYRREWVQRIRERAENRVAGIPLDADRAEEEMAFARRAYDRHHIWIEDWKAAAAWWQVPLLELDRPLRTQDLGAFRQGCQLYPELQELVAWDTHVSCQVK